MLERSLGADTRFEDLAVPLRVVAASIERAAEHVFDSGPLIPAVLASASVPGLLPATRIGDEHFIDGGVVNSIPIDQALAAGARTVFVLQVGRIETPLDRADARRSGPRASRSRSRAGTGSHATWRRCPTASRCTSCRAVARSRATTR